jgi:hypothetical protein
LAPDLVAALASVDTSTPIDIAISSHINGAGEMIGVRFQQALAMIDGTIETQGDLDAVKDDVVAAWLDSGTAELEPLLTHLEAVGADSIDANPFSGTVRATLTAEHVEGLLLRDDVVAIELDIHETTPDVAGQAIANILGPVDGNEVADYLQSNLFYNRGYYGDSAETVVVTEPEAEDLKNSHVVFNNGSGGDRVFNCAGTHATICTWTVVPSSTTADGGHATKVTSILAGDLTQGQDSSITNPIPRINRSGVARRTKILAIDNDPRSRVQSILGARGDVFIVNQSASTVLDDPNCLGDDTRSQDWNALYEAGYTLINSAGNNTNSSTTDCTVGSPGSAIGVLPVAAIRVENAASGGTEDIHMDSARGGTATEGADRTIMGLSQLTGHNFRAIGQATGNTYENSSNRFGTTSAAAPTVTGGASVFREWFVDVYGSLVDDPGIMYANLLLQGDGLKTLGGSESYQRTGFDNLYGAGRFRMRAFDGTGMDQPAGWETGSWCIADGAVQYMDLYFGNAMPSGVDYIKGTAWWYDKDHDHAKIGGHDTYDMSIQQYTGSPLTWTIRDMDSSKDSRKRVFYEGSELENGGSRWRIAIRGKTVVSDNEGCGTNSNRVYYAFYWEDNERDDGNDVDTYVRPEAGGN